MVKLFGKPFDARAVEARARAKERGVRVTVVVECRNYVSRSQSEAGVIYRMVRSNQGWECECRGYGFTGSCKHIGALARRAMREGWSFGVIAARFVA